MLVKIFLYEPTFLLSRLLISLKISSDVISEERKSSLTLIVSLIKRAQNGFQISLMLFQLDHLNFQFL